MRHLIKLFIKLFSPMFFLIAFYTFRSKLYRANGRRHRWIMNLFRLAADCDHRQALSVYGHLLHLHGDNQQSKIQGGIYLQRAAEMGDMKAQFQIAKIYEHGFASHFQPSPMQALKWYQQAAKQDHAVAISRLVDVYENGQLGVEVDQQQSEYWQRQLPG